MPNPTAFIEEHHENALAASGVPVDRHYADQAEAYIAGQYLPMHLGQEQVQAHTRSSLQLIPGE